jgi:hypothetical protein
VRIGLNYWLFGYLVIFRNISLKRSQKFFLCPSTIWSSLDQKYTPSTLDPLEAEFLSMGGFQISFQNHQREEGGDLYFNQIGPKIK